MPSHVPERRRPAGRSLLRTLALGLLALAPAYLLLVLLGRGTPLPFGRVATGAALVLAALLIVGVLHLVYRRLDEVERAVHDFAFRWGFAVTLAASLAQAAAQGGELGGALPLWPVALVAWQLALVVGWWRIR